MTLSEVTQLPGQEVFAGETIAARRDDPVGWIVFGGDRAFTVDEAFPGDFVQALDVLSGSRLRAIILAGTTPVFCAGANLRLAPKLQRREFGAAWLERQHDAVARLVEFPLPTVAAVHAAAAGAGCNIALACDFVLATPTASFTQAFVRIGLAPDMGSLFLLPRRVGFQAARELMLTGRAVAGEEARHLGLVDELCELGDLWARSRALAEERANGPLGAYAAIKEGVARGATASLRDSLAIEAALQLDLLAGPDFAEGSRAFLEKRPPVFHRNSGSGAASQ